MGLSALGSIHTAWKGIAIKTAATGAQHRGPQGALVAGEVNRDASEGEVEGLLLSSRAIDPRQAQPIRTTDRILAKREGAGQGVLQERRSMAHQL